MSSLRSVEHPPGALVRQTHPWWSQGAPQAQARHPWPARQARPGPAQSTRGMMVKGTAGLLASSSRAVRKHSVAAASLP